MIPLELIDAGQQAVSAIEKSVESGTSLIRCQLLASTFYEALEAEWRLTDRADAQKRELLAATVGQCRRTALAALSPADMLVELKTALGLLQSSKRRASPDEPKTRAVLRVIKGGLS